MLKLRYKLLISLSACALAFMPMACTEEQNLAQPDNNQEELEPAVSFTGSMNSPSSRTSGKYGKIDATNLGITFYWTTNDHEHMYINRGTDASPMWERASKVSFTDKDATTHSANASFRFKGKYENKQYTMLYVGGDQKQSSKSKLYVDFARIQKQTSLDDGELANSGDCGVAKTTCDYYKKEGKGWGYHGDRHTFKLEHKAAYVTFMPYNPRGHMDNTYFVSAQIEAKESLYGKFLFTEKGVDVSKRPLNQNKVTLNLATKGMGNGLPIASNKEDAQKHAGIMVLPPGKYTDVLVKFIIKDHSTGKRFDVKKSYPVLNLETGMNQPIFCRLEVVDFTPSFNYYTMWGAEDPYYTLDAKAPHNWNKDATGIPAPEDERWPHDGDARWYSEDEDAPAGVLTDDALTINDASYILAKDCYWDENYLWAFDGHLQKGALWVPIISKGHAMAFDGKDWTSVPSSKSKTAVSDEEHPIVGYYPLPLIGRYENGALVEVGKAGYYWINRADPSSADSKAYYLKVTKTGVSINHDGNKEWGCVPFTGDIRP